MSGGQRALLRWVIYFIRFYPKRKFHRRISCSDNTGPIAVHAPDEHHCSHVGFTDVSSP
jgi:hypothetical protein